MEIDLVVTGVHTRLFDDDPAAAFVASDEALVPWSEDADVLMDRYDVRHLIHDASVFQRRHRHSSPVDEGISQEELDYERYRDFHEASRELERDKAGNDGATASTSGLYTSVPFDYPKEKDSEKEKEKQPPPPDQEEALFVPGFPVPDHLQPHLPRSQKIHQIISGTAKFVSERGGQAEVILKVKQAGNPKFGFLLSDHVLHPYFRYLVDHPEVTGAMLRSFPPPPPSRLGSASITKPAEGLRLLGEVYGENDEENDKSLSLPPTVEIRTIKEPPPYIKTVIDKMVEFIARNGKDFEDVVRDKDKSDERFHFLHPWHEYHPYYLRMLQNADQATSRRRSSLSKHRQASKPPANLKASSSSSSQEVNSRQRRRSTRFDVPPPRDETKTAPHGARGGLPVVSSEDEFVKDIESSSRGIDWNQQQQSGMSYDDALAAVLAATRGIQKPRKAVAEATSRTEEEIKADIKAERLKRAKMLVREGGGPGDNSSEKSSEKDERRRLRDDKVENGHERKRKHHHTNGQGVEGEVPDDIRAKVRAMLQQL
ncbi:splicing factor, suppressor of white-apricot homolog [Selaginella moellendorffii]|uniref:splicing factor, suppressor of white-apricot homolog n=1 Tax=Selaginella moellendorffii TaxID=88036 RepID=UPI000D1CF7FB|nr:splicing factor, suppressor of white-apricot homolog [Selaginella moellendorffii]|eukprot:XP_024532742.1 splicing factor, suppressor of white-apricot homolog [Selaginella moellendorffii]